MADVFMYADETGDLDMTGSPGASTYFGFGTAVFADRHGDELWQGMHLRCQLERKGLHLPRGMHAKNDSHAIRQEVLDLIASQAPRFDTTFLHKAAAYASEPARSGSTSSPGTCTSNRPPCRSAARATPSTSSRQRSGERPRGRPWLGCANRRRSTARSSLRLGRRLELGVQVADYGLRAVQRQLEGRACLGYATHVQPSLQSTFTPWGRASK